jgi:UDP-N-acetylmuramyl pentapeptide phosphotransferase/UDP-N-acetylglucosamine-1-phosphate transferase
MRIVGILLIVLGILMVVFTSFNFQTEKKVVDLGPIQVDKKENHTVGWPTYAGGIALVAGIVVLVAGTKKN